MALGRPKIGAVWWLSVVLLLPKECTARNEIQRFLATVITSTIYCIPLKCTRPFLVRNFVQKQDLNALAVTFCSYASYHMHHIINDTYMLICILCSRLIHRAQSLSLTRNPLEEGPSVLGSKLSNVMMSWQHQSLKFGEWHPSLLSFTYACSRCTLIYSPSEFEMRSECHNL